MDYAIVPPARIHHITQFVESSIVTAIRPIAECKPMGIIASMAAVTTL